MSLLQGRTVDCLFFNGPVQNGDFTFASKPGKAVGIWIAEALNHLLGARPMPHLWNTVRLDGDLRYRRHAATGSESVSRESFEAAAISAKYGTGPQPAAGTITDADPLVAQLAMEMIECRLAAGILEISFETVRVCARCAHMTSSGGHPCRACGHTVVLLGPPQLSAGTRRSTLLIGTLDLRVPATARAASAPATAGWQQPASTNLPALRRPQKVEVTPWRA